MKRFIKKYLRLFKYRRYKNLDHPIHILHDCINQLAALYAYVNSADYRESQRDILNLRSAEIKYEIEQQLKKFKW